MNGSLSDLGKLGFRTVAMALTDNSISIDNPVLVTEPQLAIVMGTEGDGLPPETIAEADYVVRIPMSPGVDSVSYTHLKYTAKFRIYLHLKMKNNFILSPYSYIRALK